VSIMEDRLALIDSLHLQYGSHKDFEDGVCAMEMASWLADEPFSDHPKCVSPVITAFMVEWNDSLPDADRDRLLKTLIPLTIGTRTTEAHESKRAWMATDWMAREMAPAWLRLAGLTDHAEALEGLTALTSAASAKRAQPTLSAALSASLSAAHSASRLASHSAALSAAYSASHSAALSAAYSAAYSELDPTVKILQTSAFKLVQRMCEVGRKTTTKGTA